MAKNIHIVSVAYLNVDSSGNVIRKNDPATTIRDISNSQSKHVVIPDASVPNSSGYPAVDTYLKAEAAGDYVLKHIDQNTIITYQES